MGTHLDQTALDTIELLEARLRRIEYVLTGQEDIAVRADPKSASRRIEDIGHALDQLSTKSRVIQDLLKLHTQYPDLFHTLAPTEIPSSLDTTNKLSIVLAAASSYPLTASRLTSIHDTPLPTAEASAQLIETQTLAAKIELQQDLQAKEISSLKQRSAAVIQRWYAIDVLSTGEYWADLEGRVEKVEQVINRAALAREREENVT